MLKHVIVTFYFLYVTVIVSYVYRNNV